MTTRILFFILCLIPLFLPAQNEAWKKELLQKVNELRRKGCQCGSQKMPSVGPLQWNTQLELAAEHHATDMFQKHYFDHYDPNGNSYVNRIDAVGYNWKYCGENIAQGQKSVKEVFADWLKSPSHCVNMMGKNFREMGASQVSDYWVQELGKKL